MQWQDAGKGLFQLILVVVFVVFCFSISHYLESTYEPLQKNSGPARVPPVRMERFEPTPYLLTFEVTGTVIAQNSVPVMPQVSGRVTEVSPNFYPGGSFEANEPLFKIDQDLYTLAVKQATAELERTTADLALERAEIEAAVKGWRQLNGNAPVPKLVAREPQLERSRAQVEITQLQLEKALLDLERTAFSLPFEGRVISSDIAPGQYVTLGQGYGQVFDQRMMEVQTSLDPQKLYWLNQAQAPKVQVIIDSPKGQKNYTGHLARAVTNIDISTRFATAYFAFDLGGDEVLPGTFARVSITTDPHQDVIVVPADAMQTEGYMWKVTDENIIEEFHPNILSFEKEQVIIQEITAPINVVTSRLAGGFEGMVVSPRTLTQVATTNDGADDV